MKADKQPYTKNFSSRAINRPQPSFYQIMELFRIETISQEFWFIANLKKMVAEGWFAKSKSGVLKRVNLYEIEDVALQSSHGDEFQIFYMDDA